MQGWLWILVFAGLFYFMMRFGCGAHMAHGGHGSDGHGAQGWHAMQSGSANDPVCGMAVDPAQGYSEIHQGREYRFCSKNCLDKFDAEPQRYMS